MGTLGQLGDRGAGRRPLPIAAIVLIGAAIGGGFIAWSMWSAPRTADDKPAVASQGDEVQPADSPVPSEPAVKRQSPAAHLVAAASPAAKATSTSAPDDPPGARQNETEVSEAPHAEVIPSPAAIEPSAIGVSQETPIHAEVFGPDDPDVVQPITLYPQALGRLPAGTRDEDTGVVEVVVSETGTVESVRVVAPPRTLDEALVMTMSLSAVKTWRFQPAERNGADVKYRQRIRVALR